MHGARSKTSEAVNSSKVLRSQARDVGIRCLTQAAYMYICTSDIEVASQKCTAEDIPDPDLQDVISKASNIALTQRPTLWKKLTEYLSLVGRAESKLYIIFKKMKTFY